MKYECRVSKKTLGYGKDKHVAENYKILKQTYLKPLCRYDIIHSCIKYVGIYWYV